MKLRSLLYFVIRASLAGPKWFHSYYLTSVYSILGAVGCGEGAGHLTSPGRPTDIQGLLSL